MDIFDRAHELRERAQKEPEDIDIHVHTRPGEVKYEGVRRSYRRAKNPEFFRGFDPQELWPDMKPPGWMRQCFKRVFARWLESGANVKLWWDGLYRRWACWQEVEPGKWERFSVAMKEIPLDPVLLTPLEDYLPADIKHHRYDLNHCRGNIGDFRYFSQKDFEIIQRFWHKENTPEQIDNKLAEPEAEIERDNNREMDDADWDQLMYWWNYVSRAANHGRRNYSIILSEANRAPSGVYLEEEREAGYKVRVKRTVQNPERYLRDDDYVPAKDEGAADRGREVLRLAERERAAQASRTGGAPGE